MEEKRTNLVNKMLPVLIWARKNQKINIGIPKTRKKFIRWFENLSEEKQNQIFNFYAEFKPELQVYCKQKSLKTIKQRNNNVIGKKRKTFEKYNGQRLRFKGTFVRTGIATYGVHERETVLLKDIVCTTRKEMKCDHMWFNYTKQFQSLNLKEEDVVEFDARVAPYIKGYVNNRHFVDEREIDFKLNYPTKIIMEAKK